MREWLNLLESREHPHARGRDEWFNAMFGMISINVDAIKRAVDANQITPQTRDYTVRQILESIYQIDKNLFGSKELEEPEGTKSYDLMGPPVDRNRLVSLPADKMNEPVYFVMLNSPEAMWLVGLEKKKPEPGGREHPQIIDGNHRLMRRYIEGDDAAVKCLFISWEDTKKFTMDSRAGETLAELEAQRLKYRKA